MPNDIFLPEVGRLIEQGHSVTITPKGNSMRPFIENGRDKVVLAKAVDIKVGDAVLAKVSKGCFVLHRVIATHGDKLLLQGDGNIKGTERCLRADVLGIVRDYIYPTHTTAASDPWLCRRIRLWRRLRPIRRYLLFIYRHTMV